MNRPANGASRRAQQVVALCGLRPVLLRRLGVDEVVKARENLDGYRVLRAKHGALERLVAGDDLFRRLRDQLHFQLVVRQLPSVARVGVAHRPGVHFIGRAVLVALAVCGGQNRLRILSVARLALHVVAELVQGRQIGRLRRANPLVEDDDAALPVKEAAHVLAHVRPVDGKLSVAPLRHVAAKLLHDRVARRPKHIALHEGERVRAAQGKLCGIKRIQNGLFVLLLFR